MHASTLLAALSLIVPFVASDQVPLAPPPRKHLPPRLSTATKKRALKGRFLHITDIHPDPHYKAGATLDSGCHRKPKKKDKGKEKGKATKSKGGKEDLAGRWGTGVSDCDSPMSLVDMTFEYLKREWADEIDFVVWTGDNVRHDIDRATPRTPKEIFKLNRMITAKMLDTFPPEVPIVPSIGNNDIYPHNVLAPGPNSVTSEFMHIWDEFVPEDESHVFERGAYFSVEVIPDHLAVISLNTLFWYDANTLVDGCKDRSSDPGALEMDWLEVQLSEFRERGMQVWLTGHVPPHMGHYFDNCYLRYGDLALRYQDTIVGHLFGHMNIDHFFFIDVQELESASIDPLTDLRPSSSNATLQLASSSLEGPPLPPHRQLDGSGRYRVTGRSANNGLQDELKKDFGEMPGPQKIKLKDYVVVNVAPSIIPTYLPGLRIFSYNISDIPDVPSFDQSEQSDFVKKRKGGHRHGKPKDDCSLPENEDKPHCEFKHKPRYSSSHSPSRRNGPLSPLGYAQFFLPNIDSRDAKPPSWKVEYTTYKLGSLLPDDPAILDNATQPLPVPLHFLPGYDADLVDAWRNKNGGDGDEDETVVQERMAQWRKQLKKSIAPWRMKDLTIPSWVKLARKLVVEKKMWQKFSEIMFVSSDASD